MRILWFTNTPSLAENKMGIKPVGGGWIKSLEKAIVKSDKIELGIVFYSDAKREDFKQGFTRYYPITKKTKTLKVLKLYDRLVHKIEPENDIWKFVDIIKEFKPDIIHVLGTEGPFGMIQQRIKDIPIVISIQGNLTVYNDKYYAGFTKQQVKKYSSLKSKLLFKTYNDFYKVFIKKVTREQRILESAKYIIGRTDWDRRITRVLSPKSTYFYNDEILRDIFYKKKWVSRHKDDKILFSTTGNDIYKGLETIVKSAKLLDDLGVNFKWNIAGISINDELVWLTEKMLNLKVSKNIVFLGRLSENDLIDQLLEGDIYVMASHIENSPNNLCEAMILGIPCIATYAGGTSSLMTNNKEGVLVQDGDSWVLTGAIMEFINDNDKALKYGRNARKRALLRHNRKRIVEELLNIYMSIKKDYQK